MLQLLVLLLLLWQRR